jgi:hypothetical protein
VHCRLMMKCLAHPPCPPLRCNRRRAMFGGDAVLSRQCVRFWRNCDKRTTLTQKINPNAAVPPSEGVVGNTRTRMMKWVVEHAHSTHRRETGNRSMIFHLGQRTMGKHDQCSLFAGTSSRAWWRSTGWKRRATNGCRQTAFWASWRHGGSASEGAPPQGQSH